jgi:putative Holliday junction resolvase
MNILGFDYGSRAIGVALGNRITRGARPLAVLRNGDGGPDWSACDELVKSWQPDTLVVGLPLTLEGAEQRASRAARAFAGELEQRYRLPVQLSDERSTSQEAARRFAARRAAGSAKRKHAEAIDAVAAEVIIESWLATQA